MTKRQTWYFTFGPGHIHPRSGVSLENCYTTVYGTYEEARQHMFNTFGKQWSMQYPTADDPYPHGAGVHRYNLTYVSTTFYDIGELLPPSPHELCVGVWKLEAVDVHITANGTCISQVYPYEPNFAQLAQLMEMYHIPETAIITHDYDDHALIITWDTNVSDNEV